MKRGELFAIGEGCKVYLLCECLKVEEDTIHGRVLNGAWDFTFREGILTVKRTEESHPSQIVWSGHLPDDIGNYNDIQEYLERRLTYWPIMNWALDVRTNAIRKYKRIMRATKSSLRAAISTYHVVYREDSDFVNSIEDTIPF